MPHKAEDPRSTLIELAEEGRFSWELIAREFIQFNSSWELIAREFILLNSKNDVQGVLDTLTDNY